MIKTLALTGCLAVATSITVMSMDNEPFVGREIKDPYPLQRVLNYELIDKQGKTTAKLLSDIIENLDIENNERYFQVGVKYLDEQIYEIPLQEVEDFGINVDYQNTYCNIFVIDVLNILANTTGDDSYRIVKTPVNANNLRNKFATSSNWREVSQEDAAVLAKYGNVVILSYVNQPHGHVAIVRPDSTKNDIYLWNVGAENSNKLLWNVSGDFKFYVHK